MVYAVALLQLTAGMLEQRLRAAQMHRREAHRPAAEGGLLVVVAGLAQQVGLAQANTRVVHFVAGRSGHAHGVPKAGVDALYLHFFQRHDYHLPAQVLGAGQQIARNNHLIHLARTRAEGFAALDLVFVVRKLVDFNPVPKFRIPDSEQLLPFGGAVDPVALLLDSTVQLDQMRRINVTFVDASGGQTAAPHSFEQKKLFMESRAGRGKIRRLQRVVFSQCGQGQQAFPANK